MLIFGVKKFKVDFDETYEQFHKLVFCICKNMVKDENIAMDLMQETFVRFYKSMHKINDKAGVKNWLCKIAKNCSLTYITKMSKFNENEFLSEEIIDDKSLNPEEEYLKKESIDHIQEFLKKMNPIYEIPLELKYIEGYSPEEIAKKLDIPKQTVYTRLRRGELLLKEYIHEKEDLWHEH